MVSVLASQLHVADIVPDCIVGIARGGCVPAVALSHILDLADFYTIRAQIHGSDEIGADKKKAVRVEPFAAMRDFEGLKVLLVDDVLHSGATALACYEFVLRAGAAAVYFAALLQDTFNVTDPAPFLPCPVITSGSVNAWIIFPWEPSSV